MANEVMEMAGIGQDKPNFEKMERFVQKKPVVMKILQVK